MRQQRMWWRRAVLILQAVASVWLVAGCATVEDPVPGSLAWVRIAGRSDAQVHSALCAVFAERTYKPRLDTFTPGCDSYKITFERKGGKTSWWIYGDLLDTGVQERVKVAVTGTADNWLISLEVFMVSNSDQTFESEHRLTRLTHDTYQQLLDSVKARTQ